MSLVSFSDVSRFYGRQDVLTDVTFSLEPGERVGLVGRNGAGKTTVIRLIMGEESPDSGQVTKLKNLKIGYLPQEILTQSGKSILDLVLDTDPEYRRVESSLKEIELTLNSVTENSLPESEVLSLVLRQGELLHEFERMGGWGKESLAKKILMGLGFEERDFERDLSEFSGGWIMRAVLARLLLADPDLLILDEPTNHLDLDSLIWLEGYLKSANSAILLVSHDRVFLNNVSNKIIELRSCKADVYQGNYEAFLEIKALRVQTEAAAFSNQQDRIKQMEKFIEKNRVRASTARRAQSRVKALEKMDKLSPPENIKEQSFNLKLPIGQRGPDMVAELTNVAKSYGDISVFSSLNFSLKRGDRVALVGPNGRGKSTLIKLLGGIIPPTSGTIKLGKNVDIGYFSQFQMDSLDPNKTVIEEFDTAAGKLTIGAQRSTLGGFLFSGDDVFKKVKVLSGGEKTRLLLAKIMMRAPNLLLLDEPTNHLDIPGRQMLEEALSDYRGTMVLISHDRHFINKLCSSVGIIENEELIVYPGDYDDYRDIWLKKIEEEALKNQGPAISEPKKEETQKPQKRDDSQSKENKKLVKALQKSIAEKETRLDEISAKVGEKDAILSDPKTYRDEELVKTLVAEKNALKKEEEELELLYEKDLEELESLNQS
jgi:ATP-binding cassette subfamily F protein 3